MATPLLLDQLGAQHRSELLTEACWHRASKRAAAGTSSAPAGIRPVLSRLTRRPTAVPQLCCA